MSVRSEEALERIADALENISSRLLGIELSVETLEELTHCISTTEQYGSLFCIAGNVSID